MHKKKMLIALCFVFFSLISCGTQDENSSTPKAGSSVTTEAAQESKPTEDAQQDLTNTAQPEISEDTSIALSENKAETLSENQALDAIKNYCFIKNPELENMEDSDEYSIYWDVTTNDANEIVVLYRAYTGAQIRYYIDPVSGEAYVTELVPGIIDDEQRTEETLNVRDYLT
ncbi:MAG: hypothetical protein IJM55_10220 [Ruminococcus sp.]|nr:hypothetical protein [Ruminococcus sp.]